MLGTRFVQLEWCSSFDPYRFSRAMLDHPALNGSRTIDVLYLDNTYCHPSCQFPSRVSLQLFIKINTLTYYVLNYFQMSIVGCSVA